VWWGGSVIIGFVARIAIFGGSFEFAVDMAFVTSCGFVFTVEFKECVVIEFCRLPCIFCVA